MEHTKEVQERIDELVSDGAELEAIEAYIKLGTGDTELADFEEAYCGEFKDDEEFAQDMAEQIGTVDFKNQPWPQYCIDWEYAARELMMDYTEQDGYYFRNL